MYWSPGTFFALLALFTVALTSTVPAACAGVVTAHVVLDVQLTGLATVAPNLKTVAVVPGANPPPVTVTVVPPAFEPLETMIQGIQQLYKGG